VFARFSRRLFDASGCARKFPVETGHPDRYLPDKGICDMIFVIAVAKQPTMPVAKGAGIAEGKF
jgi:hypothetical protein